MEVFFDDPRLGKVYKNDRELRRWYGLERAKKIKQRIKDLQGAETLGDMRDLPGRCHELKADHAGQLSLDLDGPYRLLFRPAEQTEPGPGGGLDWTKVTAVAVMSVTDTH